MDNKVFASNSVKYGKIAVKKQPIFYDNKCINNIAIKELCIQSILKHPNIGEITAIETKDGIIYSIMPIYSKLKYSESFIQDTIKALVYLHDNGIIHADIKHDNIMMNDKDEYVLIDFGSAKIYESEWDDVTTYMFRAKEVFDKHEVGMPGDIWSLGVVYLNLKYGQSVKEHDIHYPYYKDILNAAHNIKDDLLIGMLQEDKSKRWTARQCYKYIFGYDSPIDKIQFPNYHESGDNRVVDASIDILNNYFHPSISNLFKPMYYNYSNCVEEQCILDIEILIILFSCIFNSIRIYLFSEHITQESNTDVIEDRIVTLLHMCNLEFICNTPY